jgi:hypothetical protein
MEGGFMRECGKGIYDDFARVGEALNVAVHLIKGCPRDTRERSAASMSKLGIGGVSVSSPSVCVSTNQYARNWKA